MNEPTMPVAQVQALLKDIELSRQRHDAFNKRNDRWVSSELSTNVIFRSAMPYKGGWHATKEAGERRAHIRIRVPVAIFDAMSWARKKTGL